MQLHDALLQRALRGVSTCSAQSASEVEGWGDLSLDGVRDVQTLFDQLREYREQLPDGHYLKAAVLPDERPT